MTDVMGWVSSHWEELLLVLTGTVTAASVLLHVVAPLTANKKDDEVASWLDKALALLKKVSLNKSGA